MSDSAFIENFSEKFQQIVKVLKSNLDFNLIFIQTNAFIPVRHQVKNHICNTFPERLTLELTSKNNTYKNLIDRFYGLGQGIAFIDDFDNIIKNEDWCKELNHLSKRLGTLPVSIICFVIDGTIPGSIHKLSEFFKLKTLVLDLKYIYSYNLLKSDIVEDDISLEIQDEEKKKYLSILNGLMKKIGELVDDDIFDVPLKVHYLYQIVNILEYLQEYAQALNFANDLMRLVYQYQPNQKKDLAKLYMKLGKFHYETQRFEDAELHLDRALLFAEESSDKELLPKIITELAISFRREGDYLTAKTLFEKALTSAGEIYGKTHSLIANYQTNLAIVFQDLGDHVMAQSLLEKALSRAEMNYVKEHPKIALRQANLALVYQDMGEYEKAKNYFERALHSLRKHYPAHHHIVTVQQSNLAQAYRGLGNYKKARQLLEEVVKVHQDGELKNHPSLALGYYNLAWVYRDIKNWKRAKDFYEKSYKILLNELGAQHPNSLTMKENIRYVEEQMKDKTNLRLSFDQMVFKVRRSLKHAGIFT